MMTFHQDDIKMSKLDILKFVGFCALWAVLYYIIIYGIMILD